MSHTNEQHEQQSPAEIARSQEAERRIVDQFAGAKGLGVTDDPRAKVNIIIQIIKRVLAERLV